MVSVLSDGKDSVIGIMVEGHMDIEAYAARIMKPESEIFHGRFKPAGEMVRIGRTGVPCTYWSKIGRLNLVKVVSLNDIPDDNVFFHRDDDGKLIATMGSTGQPIDREILTVMPLPNAIIIGSLKDEYAGEFTRAIQEMFERMTD